jgi:hypothetical protein
MRVACKAWFSLWFAPAHRRVALSFIVLSILLLATSAYAAWTGDWRLTRDPAQSQLGGNGARCLISDEAGGVHLVWYDYRDGNPHIYYKKFDNMVWTADQRVTADPAFAYNPSIAVAPGGGLHLVWQDARDYNYEIYYKHFDGTVWSADQRLTNSLASSRDPSMAVDAAGTVHLVWRDDRDGDDEIYYKRFDGLTWSVDLRLTSAAGASRDPCIVAGPGGTLHVVWYDNRDGNYEIYYKTFDGSTWSEDRRLTVDAGVSENPCAAIDSDGMLHVVWDDNRTGNFEIYQKVYDGAAWSTDEQLSPGSLAALAPAIAVGDSGAIHVVWYDKPTAGDSTEIYCRRFDGTSWGAVERLTTAAKSSENPAVLEDARGQVHAVWRDNRDNNFEIYWKWDPKAPLPAPEIASVAPDSAFRLESATLEIFGSNLIYSISARLEKSGEPPLPANTIDLVSTSHISAHFVLTNAPGVWDLIVENIDSQKDTLPAAFEILALPKPVVTAVVPDSGAFKSTVSVSIFGGPYVPPDSVWLQMTGRTRIVAKNVSTISHNQITCNLTLTGVVGAWDVVVVNADGQRDTLATGFRVVPVPGFRVDAIAPDSGWSNEGLNVTGITGASFVSPAQVWLAKAGEPTISAQGVTVVSSTRITCRASLQGAAAGSWDVVVMNADGVTDTLPAGLRVLPAEWTVDTRLTDGPGASWVTHIPARAVAVDSAATVHVVWHEGINATYRIYYKRLDGTAWSGDVCLTPSWVDDTEPAVSTACGQRIDVVWRSNRDGMITTMYRFSLGQSIWSDVRWLTSGVGKPEYPSIAGDAAGSVAVVWDDASYGNQEIFCIRSAVPSGSWSSLEQLTEDAFNDSDPSVACDALGRVHVVWEQVGSNRKLFYRVYDGLAWSAVQDIAPGSTNVSIASTAAHDSTLHVAWAATGGIFYLKLAGSTWEPIEQISTTGGYDVSIAVDRWNRPSVAWRAGSSQIYVKKFDRGQWGPDRMLTAGGGNRYYPSLAVDGEGRCRIVWTDTRDGNYEVYYKGQIAADVAGVGDKTERGDAAATIRIAPNPVASNGPVKFSINSRRALRLTVFDVTGRLVWECLPGGQTPGALQISWDGADRFGRRVEPGIYFVHIEAGTERTSKKLVIIR